jgi:hypothetical protein
VKVPEDPAEVEGSEAHKLEAFRRTYMEITQRIHPPLSRAVELAAGGDRWP